jgi:protein-tyrosine kinase
VTHAHSLQLGASVDLRRREPSPDDVYDTSPPDVVDLDPQRLIKRGIFGFEPLDVRSRSFVLLRSQLLHRFHRSGGRILAVTSTQAGNGKTYVTSNVATAMSRIHPTILIDLDLRRPAIADRLGVAPKAGIDDYLAGDARWDETRIRVSAGDLAIHPARLPRSDSARLLASPDLGVMLNRIRTDPKAPMCIVDTPPVLVLDDIMLIARNVDGILMIIEEGSTRGADLVNALRLLSPTPIVGSVLNKSLSHGSAGYAKGYYDAP